MTDQAQVPIKENWFQVLTKSLFYSGTIILLFPLILKVSNPVTVLIVSYSILTFCLGMVATSMYNRLWNGRCNYNNLFVFCSKNDGTCHSHSFGFDVFALFVCSVSWSH